MAALVKYLDKIDYINYDENGEIISIDIKVGSLLSFAQEDHTESSVVSVAIASKDGEITYDEIYDALKESERRSNKIRVNDSSSYDKHISARPVEEILDTSGSNWQSVSTISNPIEDPEVMLKARYCMSFRESIQDMKENRRGKQGIPSEEKPGFVDHKYAIWFNDNSLVNFAKMLGVGLGSTIDNIEEVVYCNPKTEHYHKHLEWSPERELRISFNKKLNKSGYEIFTIHWFPQWMNLEKF